jgi:hypothetical protein
MRLPEDSRSLCYKLHLHQIDIRGHFIPGPTFENPACFFLLKTAPLFEEEGNSGFQTLVAHADFRAREIVPNIKASLFQVSGKLLDEGQVFAGVGDEDLGQGGDELYSERHCEGGGRVAAKRRIETQPEAIPSQQETASLCSQ